VIDAVQWHLGVQVDGVVPAVRSHCSLCGDSTFDHVCNDGDVLPGSFDLLRGTERIRLQPGFWIVTEQDGGARHAMHPHVLTSNFEAVNNDDDRAASVGLTPIAYELRPVLPGQHPSSAVQLERCRQRDGSFLWAVRQFGNVLGRDGELEHDVSYSLRDDGFMTRCRFKTIAEALQAWGRVKE
jgi:hypothetical protein